MTQQEALKLLPLVLQMDIRLQVHSFEDVNGVYKHTKKCPRCCAFHLLSFPLDKEIQIDYD